MTDSIEPDYWRYEVKAETDQKEFWNTVYSQTPPPKEDVRNVERLYNVTSIELVAEYLKPYFLNGDGATVGILDNAEIIKEVLDQFVKEFQEGDRSE